MSVLKHTLDAQKGERLYRQLMLTGLPNEV